MKADEILEIQLQPILRYLYYLCPIILPNLSLYHEFSYHEGGYILLQILSKGVRVSFPLGAPSGQSGQ